MPLTACTIQVINLQDNPNEGRTKINNNFECLEASIELIQASSATGATIVDDGSNISIGLTFTGVTPIYTVGVIENPIFTSLSASNISGSSYFVNSTPLLEYLNLYELWSASTGTNSIIANNGTGNISSGDYALSIGFETSASSYSSVAAGVNSIANAPSETLDVQTPITVISACTITLFDPNHSFPAVVFQGNVVNEWGGYVGNFCSEFLLYNSSGNTQTINIGCNFYDYYYDTGTDSTYIVDTTISATTYTIISGDTFYNVPTIFERPAFSFGINTQALGISSYAEGYLTTAIGQYSHAEGNSTISSGINSHAEGVATTALGQSSHSEGDSTTSNGYSSHAEGQQTTAIGQASHAEGEQTQSLGTSSHAEGYLTIAIGQQSHAEGFFTTAVGIWSHSEGLQTKALGQSSHAEGGGTIASGNTSHSEGSNTSAVGDSSHSEGSDTSSVGNSSHSEGSTTTAIGFASHTEGASTIAEGQQSHAEGFLTTAIGFASHTEGAGTITRGSLSHAEGCLTTSGNNPLENLDLSITPFDGSLREYNTNDYDVNHVEGILCYANNSGSHAEGAGTVATGFTSHSEGLNTRSYGASSHAEGLSTTSLGRQSHSEGFATFASGENSHAEGNTTTASGEGSHSEGNVTIANGLSSHAEGSNTFANGQGSHSQNGYNLAGNGYTNTMFTVIDNDNIEFLYDQSTYFNVGDILRSIGDDVVNPSYEIINIVYSGGNTTITVTGGNFTSLDLFIIPSTQNTGQFQTSEGRLTLASAGYSHAEGNGTRTFGTASHAEGNGSMAIGDYSHAGGSNSISSGQTSFIHSTNSFAFGDRSAVIGGVGISGYTNDTVYVPYLNIQSIQTGSSVTNLGVDSNGNVVSASAGVQKYATDFNLTASTTSTITHSLGTTDVQVQLKDSTGALIIPGTVNNYQTNSVDINVSVTDTYRIIIIG